MKNRIVLLGPPATGKGTQAALLSAAFGLPAASTGAILRAEKTKGSAIGLEAENWTARGLLFPDELALRVVWQWIDKRTRYLLDLPEETIRQRMVSRLTCLGCGAVYNESFHRINGDSPCPACGAALSRRSDDTTEALDQRMAQYREQTLPVAEHYRGKGLLKKVDASPGRDAVFNAIYEDMQAGAAV